jgi:hypothetical protein
MKSLALDLDSGKLSRWADNPRGLDKWTDRYGDMYTIRIHVYRSSGGKIPTTSLQVLIKRLRRRDAKAIWSLDTFTRVPGTITPSSVTYVGQMDVTGAAYREALKLDASPGNDLPKVDLLGVVRAVTPTDVIEAEFPYELLNSGYRIVDADFGAVYVGLSDTGGILVRNADTNEWRELNILGEGNEASFFLGEATLGPVETLTLSDDHVRVQNGILQIKNDTDSTWVNVILRGTGNSTLALGETPPVGFTLSDDRFKVAADGRLLLRNLTTGNWHEARVLLSSGANTLALGTEYDDTQV